MLRRLLVAVSLGFPPAVAMGQEYPVEVAVLTDENWDAYVPQGKEVDAIIGDLVIRNQFLTAVIAQPIASRHANMTVRDVGGCLIDLTTREPSSDQLGCFYPGQRQFAYRGWSLLVDDRPVEITESLVAQGGAVQVTVQAQATSALPAVDVDYQFASSSPCVTIETTIANSSSSELSLSLTDDIRFDVGKEWASRTPNGTGAHFSLADHYWGQAYEVYSPDRPMQFNTEGRTSTLTYLGDDGQATLVIPAAGSATLRREIAPGVHGLDARRGTSQTETQFDTLLQIQVQDGLYRPLEDAYLTIARAGVPLATARTDVAGTATFPVSAGDGYTCDVVYQGTRVRENWPIDLGSPDDSGDPMTEVRIAMELSEMTPGDLVATVVDAKGVPVACKIELQPRDGVPVPEFGPETAEFAVKNLLYAPDGVAAHSLRPGTYDVIVSHGPEYDAVFTSVAVEPGKTTHLAATLPRVVNTEGWISSDFHSHSTPSGDNTSSQLGRVINLVCEHVEFAPCTEHNRISTYQPHIDRLGIADRLASCSGLELTGSPLPLNHQNVFPLHHHHHRQDGGAPLTDGDPQVQIERVALWDSRSEKLVQQNHPDIGWLFFDKDGNGEPDGGFRGAFGFMDVIEIHPIDAAWNLPLAEQPAKDQSHRVFHWLQLLNQGYRLPGVVNTDAHYNFHGSGGLRNWLESPTDNPRAVEVLDMVHAAEHGHVVMSNGPFLEVFALTVGSAEEAKRSGDDSIFDTAGGDLTATEGFAKLLVRVQSPNWIDVDEVFVLVNGQYDAARHFRRKDGSGYFREGVVKFEATLEMQLESDAHLIVVAGAPEKRLGQVAGGYWASQKPTAISNPIYIDVDGNGFEPNKDTLGAPLPVKDGTPEVQPAPGPQ